MPKFGPKIDLDFNKIIYYKRDDKDLKIESDWNNVLKPVVDELDELDNTDNYPFNDFQDLINEAKAKKEEILMDSYKAPLEEELNTTKDINTFHDEILDKLDELANEPIMQKSLPANDEMQMAFIYTSVVGFLLLFICYGIYLFIITH